MMRLLRVSAAFASAVMLLSLAQSPAYAAQANASLGDVQSFYMERMQGFLDSVGDKQGVKVSSSNTDPLGFKEDGVINTDGTMRVVKKQKGAITLSYVCPKATKCYVKEGKSAWRKTPVVKAREEANAWMTQLPTLMMLPSNGVYTLTGDSFTYEYSDNGVPVNGSFQFLPNGYLVSETRADASGSTSKYTKTTSVKKVPASKIVYRPSAR